MQKTPFLLLTSVLGVSRLGGVLMYTLWKPRETLVFPFQYLSQYFRLPQALLQAPTGPWYRVFPQLYCLQYSTAHLT